MTAWHQTTVTFESRDRALDVIHRDLAPYLTRPEHYGHWWFMNKQPWPIRHRPGRLRDLHGLLDHLEHSGRIVTWANGVYEAEAVAFGGPEAMDLAHTLFAIDSHHLLAYPASGAERLGPRETSLLALAALTRGAGLDRYELADVCARIAQLRPAAPALTGERATALRRAADTLLAADPGRIADAGGPLRGHQDWIAAFEETGRSLGGLARIGLLTRGLRAVLAHQWIFHANRARLPLTDQAALSALTRDMIMETIDTTATRDEPAGDLRNALVDALAASGHVVSPTVEQAMRAVPRHSFVPQATLAASYANDVVNIKNDDSGVMISCASQPGVVATMLEQLQARPGERILELGAATGYNAGLLATLVGPEGHIVTIDVDQDIVDGARAHLADAGFTNVEVVLGDGALGWAEGAPYDRIIATVGAHAVPTAWLDQLAPNGRLLAPQRLRGSVSRSIVWERTPDGHFASVSSAMNTFVPLRNGAADDPHTVIPLAVDGSVRLQTNNEHTIVAPAAFADVLARPRHEVWTDVRVQAGESPEYMELYLTLTLPNGLNQMPRTREAIDNGLLTADPYPSSTATFDSDGTVTYLARRLSDHTTPSGGKLWDFGVIGHGPNAIELADQVAGAMRTWNTTYRDKAIAFELHPLDADPAAGPGRFVWDTPLNRMVAYWS
ncbi:methyltransferase, FxLD system [Actinacidiphila paucisporea]|uniref:Protein-L-isoaspartate O-methyltransferase n=1 Tax=Actinacidiphila paucisporea TaxID=310782 RepID=A0A1M6YJK9_9ACTN|nr:methyltransferase, FxLD system [Actinacidiphila paucisporea]SHL18427.1 protein-L-isoaspartate(D-aspartate) O-methyltransferase [Actinacidiphila paucisporea]